MEPTTPTTPAADNITPAPIMADQPMNIVKPTAPPLDNNVAAEPSEASIPTPAAAQPVIPIPAPNPTIGPVSAPASEPAPVSEPIAPLAPSEPVAPVIPLSPIPEPKPAVAAPSSMPAPTPAAAGDSNSNRTRKILLVEDDDSLASVYQTRLQAEGFDIKRVPNGEDALAAATAYKPDLVLLDVMMPKVSGFDVLDILRNTPETTNVKVIMLTALSQDTDKERADKLGVDEYLVKSQVVIADVVDRIKKHLGV